MKVKKGGFASSNVKINYKITINKSVVLALYIERVQKHPNKEYDLKQGEHFNSLGKWCQHIWISRE